MKQINSDLYKIDGILLIYHHPVFKDADTIMEHVNSFETYSQYPVCKVNTEFGFPPILSQCIFSVIILHYSLFGMYPYKIPEKFRDYLSHIPSQLRIAFFQDEYQYCQERFSFINLYKINCIFTLVEPEWYHCTYLKPTSVKKIITCIPGYVSDKLIISAINYAKPDNKRKIDIGYRGRELPVYMGKGAFEKVEIAKKMQQLLSNSDLRLNIETTEDKRIYGSKWYQFLSNCHAVIGVEAGVSIFDLEGEVYSAYNRLKDENLDISYSNLMMFVNLNDYEDSIYYRTISPRHFEAAAFRTCQILFEGNYSGILIPMKHYLPLKKDFSNFDHIMGLFRDPRVRKEISDNAFHDLISSGKYSYKYFVNFFDNVLKDSNIPIGEDKDKILQIKVSLKNYEREQRFISITHLIKQIEVNQIVQYLKSIFQLSY